MTLSFKPSLNWLFLFIPVAAAAEHAGAVPASAVFFSAALAIIPVARLIVLSTEQIARLTNAIKRETDAVMAEGLRHHASYRDRNLMFEILNDPQAKRRVLLQAHWFAWINPRLEALRRHPGYLEIMEPLLGRDIKQVTNQLHWKPPRVAPAPTNLLAACPKAMRPRWANGLRTAPSSAWESGSVLPSRGRSYDEHHSSCSMNRPAL